MYHVAMGRTERFRNSSRQLQLSAALSIFVMDAFNRYHKCFNKHIRTLLQIAGHDFFLPKFKRGLHAYAMYAMLILFTITNVYTIFTYDPFTVWNAVMFMCLHLEVSIPPEFTSIESQPESWFPAFFAVLCQSVFS